MSNASVGHEEAFLRKLQSTHLVGRSGFRKILREICGAIITKKHAELRRAIEDDAKGFQMPNDREVTCALDHIKRQGIIANRNKGIVVYAKAASISGYAV